MGPRSGLDTVVKRKISSLFHRRKISTL